MNESSKTVFSLRFAVVLADMDIRTGEVRKTDVRFFDEFSDACQWIRRNGALYAKDVSNDKKVNRYFRIEKRYYVI